MQLTLRLRVPMLTKIVTDQDHPYYHMLETGALISKYATSDRNLRQRLSSLARPSGRFSMGGGFAYHASHQQTGCWCDPNAILSLVLFCKVTDGLLQDLVSRLRSLVFTFCSLSH